MCAQWFTNEFSFQIINKIENNGIYKIFIEESHGVSESSAKNKEVVQPLYDLRDDIEFRMECLDGSDPVVLKSDNVSCKWL